MDVLERHLPPVPARVLDVGGGVGVYSAWLAERGYEVELVDPVPKHIDAATRMAAESSAGFSARLADARNLGGPDEIYDALLLMGPLYHLTELRDRLTALAEARRVLKNNGTLVAAAISRFASLLDGLRNGWLDDERFRHMVSQDLKTGLHVNPDPDNRPEWFTNAYFHRPEELRAEIAAAGFRSVTVLAVEGPAWMVWRDRSKDPVQRQAMLETARLIEKEPSVVGSSAHLLALAKRAKDS